MGSQSSSSEPYISIASSTDISPEMSPGSEADVVVAELLVTTEDRTASCWPTMRGEPRAEAIASFNAGDCGRC